MRRLLVIAVIAFAVAPPSVAAPKRPRGVRLYPEAARPQIPAAAPATAPAPAAGRLALSRLPLLADAPGACRASCARRRYQCEIADEGCGAEWGRCTAACTRSPRQ